MRTQSFALSLGAAPYEVPGFLLKGDANYDAARWQATSTSVQVLRATYCFNGPMQGDLALGGIVLNRYCRLTAKNVSGETKFTPLGVGMTVGCSIHITQHFYVYPTTAFTYNRDVPGTPALQGIPYTVARFGPNASLRLGWEFLR